MCIAEHRRMISKATTSALYRVHAPGSQNTPDGNSLLGCPTAWDDRFNIRLDGIMEARRKQDYASALHRSLYMLQLCTAYR
jgi:hypothetical protein